MSYEELLQKLKNQNPKPEDEYLKIDSSGQYITNTNIYPPLISSVSDVPRIILEDFTFVNYVEQHKNLCPQAYNKFLQIVDSAEFNNLNSYFMSLCSERHEIKCIMADSTPDVNCSFIMYTDGVLSYLFYGKSETEVIELCQHSMKGICGAQYTINLSSTKNKRQLKSFLFFCSLGLNKYESLSKSDLLTNMFFFFSIRYEGNYLYFQDRRFSGNSSYQIRCDNVMTRISNLTQEAYRCYSSFINDHGSRLVLTDSLCELIISRAEEASAPSFREL